MFQRAYSNLIVDSTINFTTNNAIIIKDVVTYCNDTGKTKVGDGLTTWTSLPYNSGVSIGGFSIQSGTPSNQDMLVYWSSDSTWHYVKRGDKDTINNLASRGNEVFPTYVTIIELDNSTNRPTGRIKIADGATQFASIPWTSSGISLYNTFATGITGKSIEWNGVEWIPADYWSKDDFATITSTGTKYLRDDLTWATAGITTPISAVDGNIVIFNGPSGADIRDSGVSSASLVTASGCPNNTFQIGTSYNGIKLKHNAGELQIRDPTDTTFADAEFATVYCDFATVRQIIYIGGLHDLKANAFGTVTLDGSVIFTEATDGPTSGLSAQYLGGHDSSYFANITDIATVEENALVYSIVFGG